MSNPDKKYDGVRLFPCLLLIAIAIASLALAGSAFAEPSEEPFEIIPGSFHIVTSSTQAGAHADLTTSFDFPHEKSGKTINDVRTVIVNLPPGFVGNNTAVPTCTDAELLGGSESLPACPIASQVGQLSFEILTTTKESHRATSLFRYITWKSRASASPSSLASSRSIFTQILQIGVRPGDSGVTVTTPDIPQGREPFNDLDQRYGACPPLMCMILNVGRMR